ncbi:hypothetical protein [Dyella sp.]|uniref:hypothetical protein n=1 Tax=Dyella sp. TaxID=1869338 RepID=UPI002B481A3F|nr:hypothetical protein [Dyella sp.]HKT27374.1 hypothetical protein [Dyella sp.]
MKRTQLPLLTRLRRHRGLWVWAVAVLLFKVMTSSICLADPLTSISAAQANTPAQLSSINTSTPDDAGCLLGEAGGCHCACAHNMPVPIGIAWMLPRQDVSFVPFPAATGAIPDITRSLLRPPITA